MKLATHTILFPILMTFILNEGIFNINTGVFVKSETVRLTKARRGTRIDTTGTLRGSSGAHSKILASSSSASSTQTTSSNMNGHVSRSNLSLSFRTHNSKGQKKGKSKKRYTSAPSISSQPSVSAQPSSQPSLSTMPSSKPSSNPTTKPSQHPSSSPSSTPTLSPTSRPSSQPSVYPSSQPTSPPSSQPSLRPSSTPTSSPTSQPSSNPTSQPSISPTNQPSISFQPSVSPSTSHQPSYDMIARNEPIYNDQNEQIGTKSACTPPTNVDSARYAEKVLSSVEVQFQYLLYLDEESDVNNALDAADNILGKFLFDDYIQCQGNRIRSRVLVGSSETYDPHRPMGVSTLPKEIQNANLQCAKAKTKNASNQKCIVVDGGVSIFFESDSDINEYLQKYQLLLHLRDAMDDKSILNYVPNSDGISRSSSGGGVTKSSGIKGMDFVQATDLEFDRSESIVGRLDRSDDYLQSDKPLIGSIGGVFIGSAVIIFIAAIAAFVKRKRRSTGFGQRNLAVLKALDEEYEGNFYGDDDEEERGYHYENEGHEIFPFEDFSPQQKKNQGTNRDLSFPVPLHTRTSTLKMGNKKYSSIYSDEGDLHSTAEDVKKRRLCHQGDDYGSGLFPIKLSETRNGRRYPAFREPASCSTNTVRNTQDVHKCTSANCTICRHASTKSKIRFIPSSDFYDDIEVADFGDSNSDRFSDKTLDYSKQTRMNDRSYDKQNTVHL